MQILSNGTIGAMGVSFVGYGWETLGFALSFV